MLQLGYELSVSKQTVVPLPVVVFQFLEFVVDDVTPTRCSMAAILLRQHAQPFTCTHADHTNTAVGNSLIEEMMGIWQHTGTVFINMFVVAIIPQLP